MPINSNFKKDKCWSCEYFSGGRKLKTGIIFGDSVETDYDGVCNNKRSFNNGKSVRHDHWCSKYEKWSALITKIREDEDRKQRQLEHSREIVAERREAERNAERERQEKIDALCAERDRILSTLTPEERAAYEEDQRKAELKRQEEIRRQTAERMAREEARKKKVKKIAIVCSSIVAALVLIIVIISVSVRAAAMNAYNNLPDVKLKNYINKHGSNNEMTETLGSDVLGSGYRCSFTLSYNQEGYSEGTGSGTYSKKGNSKFMVISNVLGAPNLSSNELYGVLIFNWDDLKTFKKCFAIAEVHYGSYMVVNHYQLINLNSYPNPSYYNVWHGYGNWDNSLDLDKFTEEGWRSCVCAVKYLNHVSNNLFSENIW